MNGKAYTYTPTPEPTLGMDFWPTEFPTKSPLLLCARLGSHTFDSVQTLNPHEALVTYCSPHDMCC